MMELNSSSKEHLIRRKILFCDVPLYGSVWKISWRDYFGKYLNGIIKP